MLLALATFAGCSRGGEPRLVVLSPEVARLLVDLEAATTIVGADDRSRAFPEVAHAAGLGRLEESDVARVVALAPTLTLGLAQEPERRFAAALAERGVEVELFDPRSMDQVVEAMYRLGTLVGQLERTRRLAARTVRDVTTLAVARDGQRRLGVAWVVDRDPLTVVGGAGLLHQLLELAGAENAFHETTDERVVLGEPGLTRLRYDVVVDSTGCATGSPCATDGILCVAPDVAAVPAFDVTRRVRILAEALYPPTACPR